MPPKKGKGIVSTGAMSNKASPLPDRTPKAPLVPLTPVEQIQRELSRPGYKTPLALLNERCQRLNWERAIVDSRTNADGKTFTPAIRLSRHVKKSQNSPIEEVRFQPHPPLECVTALEARHMGAVYALFRFCSNQPISLTLPPYFRPYWTTLLADKATAPPHRAWEFTDDPFTAKKAVEQRQDKRIAETTRREGLAAGDNSSGRSTPSSSGGGGGGGGTVMLSGEWERAPEVRMAPALRELVEETIRDQMTKYPDAILQATRESNGGEKAGGEGEQEIKIDVRSLTVSLEGLGFRPSHVRSVVTFLQNALERIHNPSKKKEGEGLDPLVLALSTLSPQEAAIEWLILHLPEDDLPKRFRPNASVADFVSSTRSGKGASLVQVWLVDKLIKSIGFPRKAVETVLRDDVGSAWSESGALDVLGRRLCGWEEGEWGVEAVLAHLRSTEDGEILDSEEIVTRDERRSEELEALESVFGERFVRSTEDPSHFSIDIPPLDPSSSTNTNDDLTLHLIFPSSPIASPYPSTRYATSPPIFYVTSTTLPSYIRLHLHSLLLTLFHRPDREDLRSTLESGEGGIVFALVEFLENEWEAIVQEPPSVGIVTQHLVPKLPPPKKVEGEVVVKRVAPVKRNFNQGARREPTMQEQEGLKARTEEWQRSERFKKVLEGRMSLPAWKSKGEVLDALEKNRVLVVVGETGSGKTTQLPQFILDHEIASLRGCSTSILVTQPRRVSALGVAARVAQERLEDVDKASGLVGYAIRGERRAGRDTRLLFCTTGVLLRRLSAGGDGNLEGVSHVIVDEVHERSVDGDFLLLELRELLKRNKKIKVVLMSATINHLTFTTYFGGAPLLEIVGRTFPVEDHYLEDIIKNIKYRPSSQGGGGKATQRQTKEQLEAFQAEYESRGLDANSIQILDTVSRSDKLDANLVAAVAAYAIADSEGEKGGVLIFCPGVMEITQTINALRGMNLGPVEIMALHAQLSSQEQKRVFLPTINRKIVVATNIAETSITIDDITIVVDSGKVKETQFEAERGMQLLVEVLTSRAASRQRKGRAGRTKPGKCYKVFTRRMESSKMLPFPIPEILRTPLEALFLQVKAMREDEDVKAFLGKAIDPPKVEQMDSAWRTLMDLGAVEGEHATSKLTALGRHMSTIPVDLRLAKMLVLASIFKCLDPILSITAILSSKPLFISPMDKREEARKARAQFSTANSDLLTDCKAYTECVKMGGYSGQRNFCETNFLSATSVRDITTLRSDFLGALSDIGFIPPYSSRGALPALNVNSDNENLVKAIILGGLFPRIAKVNKPKAKFEQMQQGSLLKDHEAKEVKLFDQSERVFLHPGSVLFGEAKIPSGFVAYFAKNCTTKVFLRDATEIPLYGLLLFGGKVTVNHFAAGLMIGDGWIKLKAWTRIGVLVNQLRRLLDASLEAQFDDPSVAIGGNEEVIKTMLALLARDGLAPN